MARALIFGGSGFVGTHLARHLVQEQKMEVISADLHPPSVRVDGVEHVHADVRKPIELDDDREVDVVFNVAAIHRVPGHEDHEYFDTNVAGAHHVTDYCDRRQVARLVFTSSISVYGPSEEALSETSPLRPTTAYGKSKQQAEEIHRAWQQGDDRRRLVIVRPAVVFGPGENGNFTRLASALQKGTFVYPGRRDAIKACGYVLDLVSSMSFALDLDRPVFLYNFAYPGPHTLERICESFRQTAGLHRPRGSIPAWFMLMAAGIAESVPGVEAKTGISRTRVRKLLESTNILPTVLEAEGFPFRFDLDSALSDWYRKEPKGQFL